MSISYRVHSHDSKESERQFRSKLKGGQQEVLILQPINHSQIEFKVFIKIESEWNKLFERLADENVFGWIFDKDKEHLISRSTGWIKVNDFNDKEIVLRAGKKRFHKIMLSGKKSN